MIELTDRTFDGYIERGTTLVMLTTSWCGACKAGIREMERLRAEFPKLKIAELNLQKNHGILMRYAPNGLPYFILFKDAEVKVRLRGTDLTRVEEFLSKAKKGE